MFSHRRCLSTQLYGRDLHSVDVVNIVGIGAGSCQCLIGTGCCLQLSPLDCPFQEAVTCMLPGIFARTILLLAIKQLRQETLFKVHESGRFHDIQEVEREHRQGPGTQTQPGSRSWVPKWVQSGAGRCTSDWPSAALRPRSWSGDCYIRMMRPRLKLTAALGMTRMILATRKRLTDFASPCLACAGSHSPPGTQTTSGS